jgi:hypothetical protein
MVYHDQNGSYVLRTSRTVDGKTYYAKDCGKKAFKIYIDKARRKAV